MIGIYLRVSKEIQDESMQINAIKRCIGEEEYNNAKIYKDLGITGTTTERPDYQRLLTDLSSGELNEKVVCYEYSRLWRDLQEQTRMFKVLKALDVRLQSATEGFMDTDEDELKANILGSANVYEIKRLTRRIKEGIAAKKKAVAEGKDVWKGRGKDKTLRKRPDNRNKFTVLRKDNAGVPSKA